MLIYATILDSCNRRGIVMRIISLFLIILFLFIPVSSAFAKTKPVNDYSRLIPPKDNALIKKIPQKIMNDGELKKYLQQVNKKVEGALSAEAKKNAELIIKDVKKKYKFNTALANAANGCAMTGHMEEAIYIMGKACLEDPNPDNLNNYAAFLTMGGGGNLSIPILNKLNKQYPNNSTVLNNLGQAWFSLGDTEKSEKYLNDAVRLFAYHSQANYTKAIIAAGKGDKEAAVQALKSSLHNVYNQDRLYKLEKLGGRLDSQDWGPHMPQDTLGLEKITIPKYPRSMGAMKSLWVQWIELQNACQTRISELNAQAAPIEARIQEKNKKQNEEMAKASKNMDMGKLKQLAYLQAGQLPPFYNKALTKMRMEFGDEGGGMMNYKKYTEMEEKYQQTQAETEPLETQIENERKPINQAWAEQTGEGLPNKDEPFCGQETAVIDKYLNQINTKWEQYGMEYLDYKRKECNTRAYYLQYATMGGDDEVELMKIQQKKEYIQAVQWVAGSLLLIDKEPAPCANKTQQKAGTGKLADFYDLHCDNKSSMNLIVGTIKTSCNKMETDFSVGPLSAKWKENLDTDKIINGTVELGLSKGGELEYGPLKAEMKASAGGFVEFDHGGITDFGAKVGVSAGSAAGPATLGEIGAESRFGWNSGVTTSGTGVLSGLSI